MPTTITLTGWKEFEVKCRNMPKILQDEVGGEVRYAAEEWAGFAKRDAPKDVGFLAGGIDAKNIAPMESEVVSHAEYSAYMEWGTKSRVQVPGDLAAYAATFKGKGVAGGRFALQKMLFAWMDRVGIPVEYQWITYISIIVRGVHPHPFFFIQVPVVEKLLMGNIQKILNTEH